MEKNQIKLNVEKIEQLEKLSDHYVKEYQSNLSIHDKYINELKNTFHLKSEFNAQYQKSIYNKSSRYHNRIVYRLIQNCWRLTNLAFQKEKGN
jgi:hypothetical protein